MALAALLCIGIGVYPAALYAILPHAVTYAPYTAAHVLTQLQLLVLAALAVFLLMRTGVYPPEMRSVNLDFDWIYRRFGARLAAGGAVAAAAVNEECARRFRAAALRIGGWLRVVHGSEGILARTWSTGGMALWVALMLAGYLLVAYL
jgi:multicomponent Na+:H+ antiporter subunit D